MARPPWSAFRAELERAGFRPTKGRGQNFLLDDNLARAIARDAGVGPGDRVLEVGAGCGFLSVQLADLGAELLAVEVDSRLAAVARRMLAPWPAARVLELDALARKSALAPALVAALPAEGPWHHVSNLPYAIAAPVLALLARLPHPPATQTALVQREVAERIAAAPGGRAWGALPARLAVRYDRRAGRVVGRELFWPRPRVESRVVHLVRRPEPPGLDLAAYDALVEGLFQRRRKALGAALAGHLGAREPAEAALAAAGLDPRDRPERLDPDALIRLSAALPERRSQG